MNQTALITGASSGIGKEFATQLAAKGMDVILVARSTGKLQELATELQEQWNVNATVITADLSKEYGAKDVYKQTQELGLTVDYLVNNAGFATSGEFLSNPHETDHNQVMVNVAAVVDMTHLYLKDMVAKGSGTIINLASVVSFQPVPYMAVYGATKAFVLSFTESLWEEYRKKGIKVLALCPGATATSFFETAGDVSFGKMRTAEQVVQSAFQALAKGNSFVVDGKSNYATTQMGRFLPRKVLTRFVAGIMKK